MSDKFRPEPCVVVHVTIVNPLRKYKRHATGTAFSKHPTPAEVFEAARRALNEAIAAYEIKHPKHDVEDHFL